MISEEELNVIEKRGDASNIPDLVEEVRALQRSIRLATDPRKFLVEGTPEGGWHAEVVGNLLPGLAEIFAEAFLESGTPNYFESRLSLQTKDGAYGFTLTVLRWDGKTPHEKRVEAETKLAKLRAAASDMVAWIDGGNHRASETIAKMRVALAESKS